MIVGLQTQLALTVLMERPYEIMAICYGYNIHLLCRLHTV